MAGVVNQLRALELFAVELEALISDESVLSSVLQEAHRVDLVPQIARDSVSNTQKVKWFVSTVTVKVRNDPSSFGSLLKVLKSVPELKDLAVNIEEWLQASTAHLSSGAGLNTSSNSPRNSTPTRRQVKMKSRRDPLKLMANNEDGEESGFSETIINYSPPLDIATTAVNTSFYPKLLSSSTPDPPRAVVRPFFIGESEPEETVVAIQQEEMEGVAETNYMEVLRSQRGPPLGRSSVFETVNTVPRSELEEKEQEIDGLRRELNMERESAIRLQEKIDRKSVV